MWFWPPLWSSGQISWLQIQRSGFDSRLYKIFWEVVGLERGPLSLVSTTEELLVRKCSGSGLHSSLWPRGTLYLQKLALTSVTSGGRLVGIVRSRTQVSILMWSCPANEVTELVSGMPDESSWVRGVQERRAGRCGIRHISSSYLKSTLLICPTCSLFSRATDLN
jgi:hypothetical protein